MLGGRNNAGWQGFFFFQVKNCVIPDDNISLGTDVVTRALLYDSTQPRVFRACFAYQGKSVIVPCRPSKPSGHEDGGELAENEDHNADALQPLFEIPPHSQQSTEHNPQIKKHSLSDRNFARAKLSSVTVKQRTTTGRTPPFFTWCIITY